MVPAEGFEPPTFGLQNRCTTTVLSRPEAAFGSKHAERPAFRPCNFCGQPFGIESARLGLSERPHARSRDQRVGLVIVGLEAQPGRGAAEAIEREIECRAASQLDTGHPCATQIDTRIDLHYRACSI